MLVGFLALSLATTCMASRAIALAPSSALPTDTIARLSFEVVTRVAATHRLSPEGTMSPKPHEWPRCFTREAFWLCGKQKDGEVQWHMYQWRTTRFSLWADSVRQELMDSLRVLIGAGGVRECSWRSDVNDAKTGCPAARPVSNP